MVTEESYHRGVKQQWREANHSSPTSAEVKKTWIYTSTPTYTFMAGVYLVKHRVNYILYVFIII
jgi:hypothetical protein